VTHRLACLLAGIVLLAGCGGGGGSGEAAGVLADTAAKLGEIRSGELLLRVDVRPTEGADGGAFGYELSGPFALAEADALPLADMRYRQRVDDQEGDIGIRSTGDRAFVEVEGTWYELPPERIEGLRGGGGDAGGGSNGLEELDIADWLVEPELDEGDDVDTITADLDVVAATNDFLALAGAFRADDATIEGEEAEQLRRATRNARIQVETGADDRLLRRILVELDFALEPPEDIRNALGDVVGATVEIELAVENPNAEVSVEAPADARPYSDLAG
jgi:hypothetical protein